MRIHVATLFNCDADGRIVSLRRPWSRPGGAPRFFMGRRHDGNVLLFRHDVPDDLTRRLEVVCRSEPLATDLMRPPRVASAIRAALQDHGPITREVPRARLSDPGTHSRAHGRRVGYEGEGAH